MSILPRHFLYCLALLLSFACAPCVRAETVVSIDDLSPADGAQLAPGASLYILMNYRTDEPVRLWARPYANGAAVRQTVSGPSSQYSGEGQALGWFALSEAGTVDEIRVLAGGGDPYREWLVTSIPVSIAWTSAGAASRASPAWVGELQQEQAARNAELARQRASKPTSASDTLLVTGFMLLVGALLIAGIAMPVRSAWRWHGGWRFAAFAPLGLMAFVVLRIVIDTAQDPTSHNLWPFEILTYGIVALVIIVVLKIARRILGVQE